MFPKSRKIRRWMIRDGLGLFQAIGLTLTVLGCAWLFSLPDAAMVPFTYASMLLGMALCLYGVAFWFRCIFDSDTELHTKNDEAGAA